MTVSDKQQPGHTLVLAVGQSPAGEMANWPPKRTELVLPCSFRPESSTTIDSGCDLSCSSSSELDQSPTSTFRRIPAHVDDELNFSCPSSVQSTINQNTSDYYKQQLANSIAFQARLAYIDPEQGLKPLPISVSSIALIDKKTADSLMGGIENLGLSLSEADDRPTEPGLAPTMELPRKKTKGSLLPQILASLALAIAAMIEGYSSGYTSPALASMKHENSTIPITNQEASWVGSLMPLNALIGGIIGGAIIEKIGRKYTIMVTGLPYILSWLLITFATNLPMVYAGRSIQGFCVGLTTLVLPIYLSEILQPEVRGTLGLLPTTIGNIGILLCYVLGSYIDWKILAAFGAFLPLPFLVMMWFIPDTPRFLISKGRYEAAQQSLQWFRGKKADISQEMAEIESNFKASARDSSSVRDLFQMAYLKPLLISLGLMFFQQLSGINAVIFYTVSIFEKSRGTVDSNLSSIIVGLANFFATLGSNLVIDRLGRKILLNVSGAFMALSLGVLGIFFMMQHLDHDTSHIGWLPLATFIVYIVAFSVGYGPIPWLMMGEIFPNKVRGPAAAVATAFNWTCSFAVTKAFHDLTDAIGAHGAFWFFGAICLTSTVFVTLFVPETKGCSLEDIEEKIMDCKRATKNKDVETTRF